jgi:hypothetical protein
MKKYVKDTFNTEKIETVDFTVLKEKCDGGSLLPKAKYKAEFHKALTGKRAVVQIEKHEKFILQHAKASNIDDDLKNDKFGFVCLHYSVSESIGKVKIEILNKQRINAELLVKSFDGDACAGEDYIAFDKKITFRGEQSQTIEV